jgi:hypothetical protein
MDPIRFDAITRTLSDLSDHLPTRRTLMRALGAGLLGGGIGSGLDAEAKKGRKRRRKKKKKICLFGQRRCRDKRCHGCCADADCGGNVCDSGTCSDCPRNQRLCRGGCIPEDACCADADCTGGRICLDGTCACGPDRRLCEGACIAADACCGTDCPVETCTPENCNGCCGGDTCRNGDSANFCGRNGVACDQCASGETCDAGVCRGGGGTCSSENCGGCCDVQGTCRAGEGQNFCGRNGVACVQCGRDAFCNAGECDCPAGTTMCPNGDCIAETGCCANADCAAGPGGLCRPNHTCAYPPLCDGSDDVCPTGTPCCSGECDFGNNTCSQSSLGQQCHVDDDCEAGLTCQFYVCEP